MLYNRAGRIGFPASCVLPITIHQSSLDVTLSLTPTFPSITVEVKQASKAEKFSLLCNLVLWYSDKVELNPEDKRNKPSPPSMWPCRLVNQQGISQCPHHPLRNRLIRVELFRISPLEYCRGCQKHRPSQSQSFRNSAGR